MEFHTSMSANHFASSHFAAVPNMKLSALWGMKSNARRRWPERPPSPRPQGPGPTAYGGLIAPPGRVSGRSAYKSYLTSYTLENTQRLMGWYGLTLLQNFTPQATADFEKHGGLKVHVSVLALYKKAAPSGDVDFSFMNHESDRWNNGQHLTARPWGATTTCTSSVMCSF